MKHQWGATEPWALHGIVGLVLDHKALYVLSANAQLYRLPAEGGRTSPPVSLKVRKWQPMRGLQGAPMPASRA